jgi:hypothetical protein
MANPANVGELRPRLPSVEQQIRVVALGVGGLIALAFGNLTPLIAGNVPRWLMGVLVTLIIFAGGMLARAWIAMRNAGTAINGLDETVDFSVDPAKKAFNTYRLGRAIFRAALGVISAAAICYLAATWIWVCAPSRPSPSSEHLHTRPCLITKNCQAPTWSGRNNGVWIKVWHCAVWRAPSGRRHWRCVKRSKFRQGA